MPMGFLRQEYWGGLPFPSLRDLVNPGIEPTSPAWQADSLPPPFENGIRRGKGTVSILMLS